jgi:hypothetical protein
MIANSVSNFGGILFTPIWLTPVACYASGPLKVRLSFRSRNVPPPLPKPLHKHRYIHRHLVNVHFYQLTNMVLAWLALTLTCSGIHCGLKYQHWPMKQTLVVDQKGCQWHTVPYNSDKTNAQKSEISTKLDVYSYRRAHRRASYSDGVICRGCGVVTCNIPLSN